MNKAIIIIVVIGLIVVFGGYFAWGYLYPAGISYAPQPTNSGAYTPPTINSLQPTSGLVGTTVTINGSGFAASNSIYLNDTFVETQSNSNGSIPVLIKFVIPVGFGERCFSDGRGCSANVVNSGNYTISVRNANGTSNSMTFTVTGGQTMPQQISQTGTSTSTGASAKIWKVECRDGAFIPNQVSIKKGDTVTWTNVNCDLTWPASALHPTHGVYPQQTGACVVISGSDFDSCRGLKTGESWNFRFNYVGSWKYHDHLRPSVMGTVNVTE
ncbi:MAG TPA: IPT/TIG domain-containing protein [Candidatus Paceibacterota bacterium]